MANMCEAAVFLFITCLLQHPHMMHCPPQALSSGNRCCTTGLNSNIERFPCKLVHGGIQLGSHPSEPFHFKNWSSSKACYDKALTEFLRSVALSVLCFWRDIIGLEEVEEKQLLAAYSDFLVANKQRSSVISLSSCPIWCTPPSRARPHLLYVTLFTDLPS